MRYKKHKQYRLKNFDYSGEGEYFITICIADRKKYFGKIIDENIRLSSIGKIVDKIWNQIPDKFINVKIDTYQIMPDHFHGIIIIKSKSQKNFINEIPTFKSGIRNNPMEMERVTLGKIIRWFKGRITFEARKINPNFKWQPRFYDRVIRDDKEFYLISNYIAKNPKNRNTNILNNYFDNNL